MPRALATINSATMPRIALLTRSEADHRQKSRSVLLNARPPNLNCSAPVFFVMLRAGKPSWSAIFAGYLLIVLNSAYGVGVPVGVLVAVLVTVLMRVLVAVGLLVGVVVGPTMLI